MMRARQQRRVMNPAWTSLAAGRRASLAHWSSARWTSAVVLLFAVACGESGGPADDAAASGGRSAGESSDGGSKQSGGSTPKGDGSGGRAAGSGNGGTGSSAGGTKQSGGMAGAHTGGGSHAGGDSGSGGRPQSSSGGSGGGPTGRSACKRGVSYGYHSPADLEALSQGVSWWYNWALRPDEGLRDGIYRDFEVEFVPMVWGALSDTAPAFAQIPADATTLLGFNEPNFGEQANLSAAEAAELWPQLEEIADELDLRLVSPAVNYCGGNCQDTDPFHYLEEFFEECAGCRVDAVAIHIYVGCNPSGDNHAEWLINHVENYKSRFAHPLLLTEFACDSAANPAEQKAFLEDAVAYLEQEPRIERYAWFAGRADNVPHVDLLGEDGELTELGEAYVHAPQDPDCVR